ncbi:hypothetical protein [Streptomyces sp. NBC_00328]|uniref:hypothetical protein n=1 Tax=Streptomyces sp. NBC_00328 TaxID=2903646 RepID=UPI002E281353|nr:hypothetical protein [Streptomyces sp. NBC_00328]
MHAVKRQHNRWLVVGAVAGVCALMPGTAMAGWGPGGQSNGGKTEERGSQSGTDIVSMVRYSGSSKGGGGSKGNVTAIGNWTPPACWYEPRTAKDFQKYVEDMYTETVNYPGQHNYAKVAVGQFREMYKDGKYKDYNLDKADEGTWWVAVQDPDRWMEPAAQLCDEAPFWVVNGDTLHVPNAITPRVLAELAYNRLQLPETEVTLAPENVTKVNLRTWAWLDKARFKPVDVTAQIDVGGLDIRATTTAKPVALKLEPGTMDAETYPASGECAINGDGSIGEPYATGKSGRTPPCGLKYLRSSGNGTFALKATVTWEITWTGTGNPGPTRLPDGTFGTTQDVAVQEIQSVNR